jgi:hypothetical protein
MTSEQFEEDDLSGIIDLVEVIRIQSSGPTEAARAIRKKLYVCASSPVLARLIAQQQVRQRPPTNPFTRHP